VSGAEHGGIDLARAAVGIVDLVAAPAMAAVELGHPADHVSVVAFRLLGARQIVQALITRATGGPRARRYAASVDVLHAASMALLALIDPGRRRGALVQCAIASTFAAAEFAAARREES